MTEQHHDAEEVSYGAGGDEFVVVPWPVLFRRKIETRVTSSDRYRWWILWTVLAGLFAVNYTFTIFAVSQITKSFFRQRCWNWKRG